MSVIVTLAEAFANLSDKEVRNHLRLAIVRQMQVEMGIARHKKVDPLELTNEEIRIGEKDGKIPCIKAYRARTSASLIDSKNKVEATFFRKNKSFGY